MTIEQQVRDAIERHDMTRPGDTVLVAVSGGPDSTALLAILHDLSAGLGIRLHVAHFNHGWRGRAAAGDAAFVRRLARRYGLPFTLGTAAPRSARRRERPGTPSSERMSSREARARAARTRFLLATARAAGARRVALGHTRDDQAESVLMRLLRGSGSRGLAGIYPVVDARFVRPLLDIRKQDLLDELKRRRLRPRIDASNADISHMRNRVRLRLMPLLARRFNPACVDALARAGAILRDEDALLESIAETVARDLLLDDGRGTVRASAAALQAQPSALRRRLVRLAVRRCRGHLRRIEWRHVDAALLLLEGRRRAPLTLPGAATIALESGALVVRRNAGAAAGLAPERGQAPARRGDGPHRPARPARGRPEEPQCPVPGEIVLPGFGLRLRAGIVPRRRLGDVKSAGRLRAYLDADRTPGPLRVRPRRPGDRFRPLGAPGTRKVKRFLIDRKIPAARRGSIPLVLAGDRVAWIVGEQIEERFKVTAATRRVLVLEQSAEPGPAADPARRQGEAAR